MHTHIYTHVHTHTHTHTHIHTHVHTYTHTYAPHTHTRAHAHTHMYTHMYTHTHTLVYTHTCAHTHTHTHTHATPCLVPRVCRSGFPGQSEGPVQRGIPPHHHPSLARVVRIQLRLLRHRLGQPAALHAAIPEPRYVRLLAVLMLNTWMGCRHGHGCL